MCILDAFGGKRIVFEDLDLQYIFLNQIEEYFPIVSSLLCGKDIISHPNRLTIRYRPIENKEMKSLRWTK